MWKLFEATKFLKTSFSQHPLNIFKTLVLWKTSLIKEKSFFVEKSWLVENFLAQGKSLVCEKLP